MRVGAGCLCILVAGSVLGGVPRACAASSLATETFVGTLALGLSARARAEFWDFFDPADAAPGNDDYWFFAERVRPALSLSNDWMELRAVGQDTRFVNVPDDAFAPGIGPLGLGGVQFLHTADREQGEPFLKEGWARFKNLAGVTGLGLRFGRMVLNDALEVPGEDPGLRWIKRERVSQRLIGGFDWSHVGRSFDGVELALDDPALNTTLIWFRPTDGGFEVSANREISEIDLVYAAATLKEGATPGTDSRLFFIYYNDHRNVVKTDNRDLALRQADTDDIEVSTTGGNIIHVEEYPAGRSDLMLWGALQHGDWGELGHFAWAYAVEGGYQATKVPLKPWLRAGLWRSSGDDDPGDEKHRTFLQILPTARIYARTPVFNLMNSDDYMVQLLLQLLDPLGARIDYHYLRVDSTKDLLYAGAGATKSDFFGFAGTPTSGEGEFGHLVDVSLSYQVGPHLELVAYYGRIWGGGIVQRLFADETLDYGYLEANLSL